MLNVSGFGIKPVVVTNPMLERESPERNYPCPVCDQPLVPVWTLPKDKIKNLQDIEIREQLYCQSCDQRFAIEEVLAAQTARANRPRSPE